MKQRYKCNLSNGVCERSCEIISYGPPKMFGEDISRTGCLFRRGFSKDPYFIECDNEPTTMHSNTNTDGRFRGFGFGQALGHIKNGEKVSRMGWYVQGMYIALQRPGADSADTLPYIYIVGSDGRVPWFAPQTDILAEDWYVVTDIASSVHSKPSEDTHTKV